MPSEPGARPNSRRVTSFRLPASRSSEGTRSGRTRRRRPDPGDAEPGPSAAALEIGVSAVTDVTGFGWLGHLGNVLVASGTTASLWLDDVPILPAARRYVRRGVAPGGTRANQRASRTARTSGRRPG
ncbi:MAG TPA: AIR synthase-related protein [Polyangiaceae bacterium]|nr:AIR synthase-related protein [Polyangiaceae bacterium]